MCWTFCRKDLIKNLIIAIGSSAQGRRQGGRGQPISGEGVAGGEGQGAGDDQQVEAHLLVCLGAREGGRKVLVGDEVESGGGGRRR